MTEWKEPYPKSKPFKCSAAWHLFRSGQLLAYYTFVGALTKGGKNPYFSSIRKVAIYFYGKETKSSYENVRRGFRTLVKMGFLEREGANWRYVPHEEWAKRNPGKCHDRGMLLPWEESADPFIGAIWKISEGKVRVHEGMIKHARKVATDEEFIAEFQAEMDSAKARRVPGGDWSGTSPKSCFWRVVKFLKEKRDAEAASLLTK